MIMIKIAAKSLDVGSFAKKALPKNGERWILKS